MIEKEICMHRNGKGREPPKGMNALLIIVWWIYKAVKELGDIFGDKIDSKHNGFGRGPGSIVMSPRCQTGRRENCGEPFFGVIQNHPGVP